MTTELKDYTPKHIPANKGNLVWNYDGSYLIEVTEDYSVTVSLYSNANDVQKIVNEDTGDMCSYSGATYALGVYETLLQKEYIAALPDSILSKSKSRKIRRIKDLAGNTIQTEYPIFKQININALQGYTETDKSEMWQFINSIREQSDNYESLINNMSDIDAIEKQEIIYR